jgi:translation initiation factor IF-3
LAKNQFGGNRPGGGSRPPFGGGNNNNRNNRRDSRFPSDDDKGQFRLNDQIRVPQIRLVGDNMEQVSELVGTEIKSGEVYNTRDALQWAEKAELDLVEISPNAVPPVVRIIDYNKFLYEKKKKEKEIKAKAAKTVIKEIRFGPNTDDHDFEFKVRHAKTFLEENAKVKAYVNFRGRTIVFKDRGELLLLRFLKELEEFGAPESLPKLEGRRMIVMIAPKKKK